ncbi:MAG: S8 family serine peptidase [bacterium]|nr:S8 family serine peptidase [bacterium]
MRGSPPVVDEQLLALAHEAEPGTELDLMVWLRNRPGPRIAREVRSRHLPAIDELAQQIRDIRRTARPGVSLSPAEERAFIESVQGSEGLLSPGRQDQIRALAEEVERRHEEMQAEIRSRTKAAVTDDLEALEAWILTLRGTVLGRIYTQNGLTVRLPADELSALARDPRVARIIQLPEARPELDNQGSSLGLTGGFWANGIDGGLWDAGVLDFGVQQDHPALTHLNFSSNFGTTDSGGHGTGVAGIIASDDATYRGMAYGMDTMLVGSCVAGMSDADWMVATAFDDPEAINLSCGYGMADDVDYSSFDQFWDGLIDDQWLQVGKSAGNEGDGTNRITHPAPAYNLLAVANVWDQNTFTRTDDVISSSSSRGPTLGGRKKPDIAAPGSATRTTNNDWAGAGADFVDLGGTSAAAPHVTGAVVLLTDLRGSDDPKASKAVLLNTADAWTDGGTSGDTSDDGSVVGKEWNKTYGWGYLDLWEAWFNGLDVFVSTVDDGVTPSGPDFKLFHGEMFAGEKATLVWNRHVGYNGSSYPIAVEDLTDLDLVAYDATTGGYLTASTSSIDNVEQVAVAAGGDVVLKVEVFGTIDPDVGVESFALATEENFLAAAPPSFSFGLPAFLAPPGQNFAFQVTVNNDGDVPAFDNSIDLTPPPGFSIIAGDDPQPLGTIAALDSASASWTLQAPCATGAFNTSWSNASISWGELFIEDGNADITVGTISLANDVPAMPLGASVPQTFDFPVLSYEWAAVGVNPGANDQDLWADDDLCMTSPYQYSTYGGSVRDFTVTNGRSWGSVTHYAMVTFGPSAPYTVELDQAFDLAPGSSTVAGFTADEVVETFEASLKASEEYRVTVDVTSGSTDVALFGFRPDRADGTRGNADYSADDGGSGADETLLFTAPVAGIYGFVVVNENAQAADFTFLVKEERIFSDGFESGDTSAWSSAAP